MSEIFSTLDSSLSSKSRSTATREFAAASKFWNIILISFALDPLMLALIERYQLPLPKFEFQAFIVAGLIVAILSSDKTLTLKIYRLIENIRRRSGDRTHEKLILLSWGIHLFPAVIIVAILLQAKSYLFAALMAGFIAYSYFAQRKAGRKVTADRLAVSRNKSLWLQLENQKILLICIIPIVLARAASFCSMLTLAAHHESWMQFIWIFSACLLLEFALMPFPDQFVTRCPSCARWTSIALKGDGSCPSCRTVSRR